MSSTANRVIKNTGFLYAKMGITMFISLYTTRLILNSLGASDFGIFNIVGGAISMLGFLNAAMASATQRFMSYSEGEGNKEKQKSIFNISFILHLGLSFIVGIALLIFGYFFFNGILNIPEDRIFAAKVVYGSLIVSTMFTVMTVPYDAAMNAHENMKYYAIVGIFESLLKLSVAFVCVYTNHDKLIVYGALMACIPLITLSIMRIYCHKNYDECVILPKKYWNRGLMKEMTSFAGWNLLSTMSAMISNYAQGILINHFFSTLLNAAQGIANQLNGQLQVFSNNLMKAVNPIISKSAGAKEISKMHYLAQESARISTLIYLFFAMPMFVYSPYILKIWLGNYPDWTILFIRFTIIVCFIDYQMAPVIQIIRSLGKIKYLTKWTSIINLSSIVITFVLFYLDFEVFFLYIVNILSKITIYRISLYNSNKYCNFNQKNYVYKVIIPSILLISTFVILLYSFSIIYDYYSIFKLLVHLILYSVLFILSMLIFLNKEEKEKIYMLCLKFKKR